MGRRRSRWIYLHLPTARAGPAQPLQYTPGCCERTVENGRSTFHSIWPASTGSVIRSPVLRRTAPLALSPDGGLIGGAPLRSFCSSDCASRSFASSAHFGVFSGAPGFVSQPDCILCFLRASYARAASTRSTDSFASVW